MFYTWLESEVTPQLIESLTGKKIKSLTKGGIETEETYEYIDPDGGITELPIIKKGIRIEFDSPPSDDNIKKLDAKFLGLKRDGGKTLADEIDDLKARTDALEASSIGA